ncbi:hypothetical protein [uncultured Veillonella sp.]|nr:hypothetical protein [uncultured Veillonella sp.]
MSGYKIIMIILGILSVMISFGALVAYLSRNSKIALRFFGN